MAIEPNGHRIVCMITFPTLAHPHVCLSLKFPQVKEPANFTEAMRDPCWRVVMREEIQALENNKTWITTHLPPRKKALGCKWVYKAKQKSDGSVERFKAQLAILSNHQVENVDYTKTFATVAKMVTVQVVLAVAAARRREHHQMDVHNVFLHGDLHEEVYMKLPLGFRVSKTDMVCELKKSLYRLKQASQCWFAKLSAALKTYGFTQSLSDYLLFVLKKADCYLVVLIYVDD
ncbi:hypothetical protein L6164_006522 [Bauhinia variegata]|uniref:Uncharacterized protein n=1 Tax=Bauhinia variegata TaxID=167791 RepID=A0ACB9PUJ4_BAUVA|nr:hypothetical protein L6164_006522 [Bauhinia variegata]